MKVFDYEDIQLIPSKSIVKSRSECDMFNLDPEDLNFR